jgi:predicted signal transduction protein with EAL and GGDEF domain
MFKLLRYFSIASLVACSAATAVLWNFYREQSVNQLIESGQQQNIATANVLSNSQNFPLNTLKIDRSFIWALDNNMERHEIVQSIVMLAHNLGMTAIAGGVETPEQLQRLRDFNCDLAQGYLLAKPLPNEGVEALLASMRPLAASVA